MRPLAVGPDFADNDGLEVGLKRHFTLVELMIVVAIVAILAAIAIPQFNQMQLKSKVAEGPVNAQGISDAHNAYHAAFDEFLTGIFIQNPAGDPGKTLRDWDSGTDFDTIEWSPDGQVRCGYTWGDGMAWSCGNYLSPYVVATCDVDGDNTDAIYTAYAETCGFDDGWNVGSGPVDGVF